MGQVATQSKSIHTPFSSVHKSDVRVSNPGYAVAAPAYAGYHHAPAYTGYHHAPAAYAGYHAPAAYTGYHAPAAYAAPAYHGGVIAKAAVPAVGGLLGVAYSAAPVVSHMTYSSGLGFNYAW